MILKSQDQTIHIWHHHSGADILSATSDTTTASDNGRWIKVIPRISIEEQLREVRLQKDVQFNEYQRLYSEKKKLEEKPDTYPPNACLILVLNVL